MNNMNIIEELAYMDEKLDRIEEKLDLLLKKFNHTDSVTTFSDSRDWDDKIESYLSAADVMDDVKNAVNMIPNIRTEQYDMVVTTSNPKPDCDVLDLYGLCIDSIFYSLNAVMNELYIIRPRDERIESIYEETIRVIRCVESHWLPPISPNHDLIHDGKPKFDYDTVMNALISIRDFCISELEIEEGE